MGTGDLPGQPDKNPGYQSKVQRVYKWHVMRAKFVISELTFASV